MSIYLEGIVNAPMINLMALLCEVDLFKEWVPLMKKANLVGEYSHLRKLAYFKVGLPWPFSDREIYLQATGIMQKEDKACVLVMSSVEEDEWMSTKITRNIDLVTIDIHKSFIHLQEIEPGKNRFRMIVNADPHLDYIP